MGKSQKQRAMRRHNPMRMESPDAAERKWACVAVSNLIQNDPSTRRLLQGKNIVGALITRLTDNEEEVVVEAMGSLRNLCIDGGFDICAEMYNKSILTCLKTFVPKISSTLEQYLQNPKTAPENAAKLVYEFADNVITTLWCLSETSNKALNAINAIQLVPFLMSFLASREKLPLAPVTAAAQCLYVLTDDNDPAIYEVKNNGEYISCLLSILRNVTPLPMTVAASALDMDQEIALPLLQPVIASTSLQDTSSTVQELATRQANEPEIEKLSLKNTPQSDHRSPIEIELDRLENQFRTVQLALEILTGTCAKLPDPDVAKHDDEKEENEDDIAEDPEDDNTAMEEELDVEMSTDATEKTPNVDTTSLLPALVPALLRLIQPTSLSFPPLASASIHPPTTSALSGIHISALECLNNIFLSLARTPNPSVSSDKAAGSDVWNNIWAALRVVGTEFGLGQERRREFWEVSVGVLWGVGTVWKGSLEPNATQVDLLVQFCNSSADERARVKCIGTLECLAQHPDSIDGNRIIAEYLLSLLPSATPSNAGVEPTIQAVSAIIDIYSDEMMPYDVNFRQGAYLERLVNSIDAVKKMVKAIDRRKPGGRELRVRGEEVRDNLVAFVKYRKNLKF
ncbi:armadillo-type protein [Mucidula mucida]|nr:armadillo-type protein [Mucidula mucida]